jgi:uncharacterized protein (TIGR04552 family)
MGEHGLPSRGLAAHDDGRVTDAVDLSDGAFRAADLRVADIEAVRLLLDGRSIIDIHQMHFRTRADVEAFLRLLCYDVRRPADRRRLARLMRISVEHLRDQLGYTIPVELASVEDPVLPFLWASEPGPLQRPSLVVLKVAHVMNHVEARELRSRLPVSDSELLDLVNERMTGFRARLSAAGVETVSLAASEKTLGSTVLKLLAKRQTVAAEVHDRVRFRIIVARRSDVFPTLVLMTRGLLPFNYIIPHASRNDLISIGEMLEIIDRADPGVEVLRDALTHERRQRSWPVRNEFSAPSFRMVNFVVDLPLRVDRFADRAHQGVLERYGRVVFLLTEFQLYSLDAFLQNERGPGSHAHYKARQRRSILRRLVGPEAVESWRTPRLPEGGEGEAR